MLCRRSLPGEITLSQPINNTGLLIRTDVVDAQRRRLVEKPFGLWLAMILDRDHRIAQQLHVAAAAEAAQHEVQPFRRGVGRERGQPPQGQEQNPPDRRETRSMAVSPGHLGSSLEKLTRSSGPKPVGFKLNL